MKYFIRKVDELDSTKSIANITFISVTKLVEVKEILF